VVSHVFPVALARGKHLFPFRTEKLSPSAPMVLGSQGPGRVGRRRFLYAHEPPLGAARGVLWPIRYYVTRGSLTTPTCALHPRKTSAARRSRATLRRKLAHRQDTDRHALPTQRLPDAAHQGDSVEPSGVGAQPRDDRPDPSLPPRTWGSRSARPGRPPSRPRNRPRATGTSGPVAASSRDAAAHRACAMNRTCVRRLGPSSDGIDANRCLCALCLIG
jgi:hypothetical protein